MSMAGFQKKLMGVGGWVSSIKVFFWDFLNCFNFTKPLRICTLCSLLGRTESSFEESAC